MVSDLLHTWNCSPSQVCRRGSRRRGIAEWGHFTHVESSYPSPDAAISSTTTLRETVHACTCVYYYAWMLAFQLFGFRLLKHYFACLYSYVLRSIIFHIHIAMLRLTNRSRFALLWMCNCVSCTYLYVQIDKQISLFFHMPLQLCAWSGWQTEYQLLLLLCSHI